MGCLHHDFVIGDHVVYRHVAGTQVVGTITKVAPGAVFVSFPPGCGWWPRWEHEPEVLRRVEPTKHVPVTLDEALER